MNGQGYYQCGHIKPTCPQRRWASGRQHQHPWPSKCLEDEPEVTDTGQPHTCHCPGPHPNAAAQQFHCTSHTTSLCTLIFQRETSPGWAQPTGSLWRSCWHWCPMWWGPGWSRGDAALRGSWAGTGTDRIAGDSSGELDLALLPGSSQTLLAWCKLLPTHMPSSDVNKELQGKGGAQKKE